MTYGIRAIARNIRKIIYGVKSIFYHITITRHVKLFERIGFYYFIHYKIKAKYAKKIYLTYSILCLQNLTHHKELYCLESFRNKRAFYMLLFRIYTHTFVEAFVCNEIKRLNLKNNFKSSVYQ